MASSDLEKTFGVVDLFAGPGGLSEGFSQVRLKDGTKPFRIVLSVEKEPFAHSTLMLRSFLRQFGEAYPPEYYAFLNRGGKEPAWERLYPRQWSQAKHECLLLEIGTPGAHKALKDRIVGIKKQFHGRTILIGGPPCQAYSLVGRVRNKGNKGYSAQKDKRHFLYQEYIKLVELLEPVAFVMENVKGILSSSIKGRRIFDRILIDLKNAAGKESFELAALTPRSAPASDLSEIAHDPADFVIRAEEHGIPQARHRVIIFGLKRNLRLKPHLIAPPTELLRPQKARANLESVLSGMPRVRSGLPRGEDGAIAWKDEILSAAEAISKHLKKSNSKSRSAVLAQVRKVQRWLLDEGEALQRTSSDLSAVGPLCPAQLKHWLLDNRLKATVNHETRSHMKSDLSRYLFAAAFSAANGRSPKSVDFPAELAPKHANWKSGKFSDRFRVQVNGRPATTVTSHISKDGHYFIHPDPTQCRSLTVREAARLQTFPDNYFFRGNRTEQFVQVGNAVPPLLALKIGEALIGLLLERTHPARKRNKSASTKRRSIR